MKRVDASKKPASTAVSAAVIMPAPITTNAVAATTATTLATATSTATATTIAASKTADGITTTIAAPVTPIASVPVADSSTPATDITPSKMTRKQLLEKMKGHQREREGHQREMEESARKLMKSESRFDQLLWQRGEVKEVVVGLAVSFGDLIGPLGDTLSDVAHDVAGIAHDLTDTNEMVTGLYSTTELKLRRELDASRKWYQDGVAGCHRNKKNVDVPATLRIYRSGDMDHFTVTPCKGSKTVDGPLKDYTFTKESNDLAVLITKKGTLVSTFIMESEGERQRFFAFLSMLEKGMQGRDTVLPTEQQVTVQKEEKKKAQPSVTRVDAALEERVAIMVAQKESTLDWNPCTRPTEQHQFIRRRIETLAPEAYDGSSQLVLMNTIAFLFFFGFDQTEQKELLQGAPENMLSRDTAIKKFRKNLCARKQNVIWTHRGRSLVMRIDQVLTAYHLFCKANEF
jgi:hypothetical protein